MIIAVPEVKEQELTKNDRYLLMGCDGVFETLSHIELINFLNDHLKLSEKKEVTPEIL